MPAHNQRPENRQSIAFYAPLKSPLHPVPSGDRKIAQLFFSALQYSGFEVVLASQLRCLDKNGDQHRQHRLISLATREAARILRRWRKANFKPSAWFSYHLYYKAPDLIGPIICRELKIPYLIAEASWAEKRAAGDWSLFHSKVDQALQLADKVICINPVDQIALTQYYQSRARSPIVQLKAFIDDFHLPEPAISRAAIAKQYSLDPRKPWLISIAMMRKGDKFKSYQQLSAVIHKLSTPHQLLIIGAGEMQRQVQQLFAHNRQVQFTGALHNQKIRELLSHFEILVWPAINEALGMIFLEAQQAAVAVVAGDEGGVSSLLENHQTGILTAATDSRAMADAIDLLLADPRALQSMQQNAKARISAQHSLAAAANQLTAVITAAQREYHCQC
ncbi:MAG: hypothetical protein OFPII_15220 [Osedax symbiont Rs1]|nr:MAG: hypothetical protein OFPII_15220 [Osedax symbiont Rs1]